MYLSGTISTRDSRGPAEFPEGSGREYGGEGGVGLDVPGHQEKVRHNSGYPSKIRASPATPRIRLPKAPVLNLKSS